MSLLRSVMAMLVCIARIPTSFLIGVAAIVGTFWLALLGEWGVLWNGFLLATFGLIIISLAMNPGFLVAGLLARSTRSSKPLASMVYLICVILLCIVATLWCSYVFKYLVGLAKPNAAIASLLIAYAVAISPWSEVVAKDDHSSSKLFVYAISLSCTTLLAISLTSQPTYLQCVIMMSMSILPIFLLLFACWHFGGLEDRLSREIKFHQVLG